jgi:hypothetical protein
MVNASAANRLSAGVKIHDDIKNRKAFAGKSMHAKKMRFGQLLEHQWNILICVTINGISA